MSVSCIIIDTPTNCENCPLSYQKDYMDMCPITGRYHNTADERPEWCPLQEIPQNAPGENQANRQKNIRYA